MAAASDAGGQRQDSRDQPQAADERQELAATDPVLVAEEQLRDVASGQLQDVSDGTRRDELRAARGTVPDLSFTFPDIVKRFPPPSETQVERSLHKLKLDLVRTYKNHKAEMGSVTKQEEVFIKELAVNDDAYCETK